MIDLWDDSYVWSALWWVWSKLRYYVILYHQNKSYLDDWIVEYIKQCLADPKRILESIDIKQDCLICCVLIHIDYALDDVVMRHIDLINQHWLCVLKGYWAINTEYPSDHFIDSTREHLHKQHRKWLL